MTEPEIGRVILVLVDRDYPVIQYFKESFIELLSGSGKRCRRNRFFRWQRKLHAATVGPKILKCGAITLAVFGEHETENQKNQQQGINHAFAFLPFLIKGVCHIRDNVNDLAPEQNELFIGFDGVVCYFVIPQHSPEIRL